MQDKLAKVIARAILVLLRFILAVAIIYFLFLIYTLGSLQGSLLERLSQLPTVIANKFLDLSRPAVTKIPAPRQPEETSATLPPKSTEVRQFSVTPSAEILGTNGYYVLIKTVDSPASAFDLLHSLRQNRINAKSLLDGTNYYVYVGPIFGKRAANSTLKIILREGYQEALLIPPT